MGKNQHFTFSDLALCNLRRRPFRTTALIFLVSILSLVLFLGSLISLSITNGTDRLAKRLGADILVVPKGYERKTERILLRGEPSTFYMNAAWTKKISGVEGVRAVSPQLFVASLNANCCSSTVQIIGFDPNSDFTIEPWIKSELSGNLGMDKIVIGADISRNAGNKMKFFGRNYIVAAKMDNTGTGLDTSVFMNIEAAKKAANDFVLRSGAARIPENAVSSVTVAIQDGYAANAVAETIRNGFVHENSGVTVITAEKIISNVSGSLRMVLCFIVTMAALLWVLSVLVLGIVFSVILNERKREFGIMRSLGATRKKLSFIVLLEAGIIGLCGSVLGIGFCVLFIVPLRVYVLPAINMPYLQPSLLQISFITMASLLISFVTGPMASLVSVFKVSRGDAYAIIRDGDL